MNEELTVRNIAAGELIIGNHESLMVYGSEAQSKLREFSKTIAAILIRRNDELEDSINDVLYGIEKFQNQTPKGTLDFLQSQKKHREIVVKNYNGLLVYIDKMTVCLQMQQAQLLKDANIYNRMEILIEECSERLEKDIYLGEKVLEQAKKQIDTDDNLYAWTERLERRLDDLRVSHTVSLQSKAQLKVMQSNNMQLVDKISAAVSGTIPIWRNQITLLLGIERFDRGMEIQKKVSNITNTYIAKNAKELNNVKRKKNKEIDANRMEQTNNQLTKSLTELLIVEKRDTDIRLELSQSLR